MFVPRLTPSLCRNHSLLVQLRLEWDEKQGMAHVAHVAHVPHAIRRALH